MTYLLLKLIHVLSSTFLFGTGLGSAFYLWRSHREADLRVMYFAVSDVVMADWIFTTPAVLIQPITGILLMQHLNLHLNTFWIATALGFYCLAGACWLPVVWLQIQMKKMLAQALDRQEKVLPKKYYQYYQIWFYLGWPAFLSVLAIFYFMIYKPVL